jgi:hypothetical protein
MSQDERESLLAEWERTVERARGWAREQPPRAGNAGAATG